MSSPDKPERAFYMIGTIDRGSEADAGKTAEPGRPMNTCGSKCSCRRSAGRSRSRQGRRRGPQWLVRHPAAPHRFRRRLGARDSAVSDSRTANEFYFGIDEGILVKCGDGGVGFDPEAVPGDDLASLRQTVCERYSSNSSEREHIGAQPPSPASRRAWCGASSTCEEPR